MKKGIQLANHCPTCKKRKDLFILKVTNDKDFAHRVICGCGERGPMAVTEKIAIQRWNNLKRDDWKDFGPMEESRGGPGGGDGSPSP